MHIRRQTALFVLAALVPPIAASSHVYDSHPENYQAVFPAIVPFIHDQDHGPARAATPGSSCSHRLSAATDRPSIQQREVIKAPPAAQPTAHTQVSPVMTLTIGGKVVLYTQLFSEVPDQWPAPMPGTVGLGTLQGQVGVTKTVGNTAQKRAHIETARVEPKSVRVTAVPWTG
ncbi:hypothetical protein LOZ39_002904 [Ophidiomyces ophidiicola]|nr:hypothetical protein LOZ61_005842 [Ophidiomyces ophidiicola]KAI1923435.1 hypothetical protein LOZ60_005226 [Ophidiomyces ophidiicola]KAI2001456.1 hypothetical protein LOZ49_006632 [Ophidiomyces ophidiicola]KAI2006101.1 hypothetical protein LOZ50_003342 [Ophidiomyces ophidiicola]KAI2020684.1 hypothetical protein LOZ45_004989 [Ophidiomyces ophidiicola]